MNNNSFDFYDPILFDLRIGDTHNELSSESFYFSHLLSANLQIMDIGAGTGRLSLPLAKAGHKVVCIEQSKRMIARLSEKASKQSIDGLVLINDSFSHRPPKIPLMDVAIAVDDFLIGLLSIRELELFFSNLKTWIKPCGHFLTDIRSRNTANFKSSPSAMKTFGLQSTARAFENSDWVCLSYWEEFAKNTSLLKTTCRYELIDSKGKVTDVFYKVLMQRLYSNKEIIQSAQNNGFRLVEQFTDESRDFIKGRFGGFFKFQLY